MEDEYPSDPSSRLIRAANALPGSNTRIRWSSEFGSTDGRAERPSSSCRQKGEAEYVSGPAARSYPDYKQGYPPFGHHVTIPALLFNMGLAAQHSMISSQASSC